GLLDDPRVGRGPHSPPEPFPPGGYAMEPHIQPQWISHDPGTLLYIRHPGLSPAGPADGKKMGLCPFVLFLRAGLLYLSGLQGLSPLAPAFGAFLAGPLPPGPSHPLETIAGVR